MALDGNRLGLVCGAVIATAVMALSFFVQESNWTATAIRVGWSFVIAYALTFLLVNIIVHTQMAEAARQEALEAAHAADAEALVETARDKGSEAPEDEAESEEPLP